jgi:hypothetical protein
MTDAMADEVLAAVASIARAWAALYVVRHRAPGETVEQAAARLVRRVKP